jgi:3-dehydro-L-gulonate 2-dehydrogenase
LILITGMETNNELVRIPSDQMKAEFFRILLRLGFATERAYKCAEIFTLNSLEGVYSHGVYRFHRFVASVREGLIKPEAVPTLIHRTGSIEQWNGNLGPGPLNAMFATDRAMEVAAEHGIGMVTLANTNHWMRGGTYGWQAAKKGFVLICWTNTCPNMPAWGARDPRLGNNPMIIAVPYHNEAIVLDFAMSQYSYGKMETYRKEGQKLPYMGGFNKENKLTDDPAEILESWRPLPVGYWKGSGLSLLLDILATVLSGGFSTHQVATCATESNVSQVFLAIHLKDLHNFPSIETSMDKIIEDLKKSVPDVEGMQVRYPGENILNVRRENQKTGIPVKAYIWDRIKAL